MTKTEIRSQRVRYTAGQTNTVHLASAADERIYVTGYSVANSNNTSMSPSFLMGFASDGVTPETLKVIASHPGIAPGSGLFDLEESQDTLIHGATGDDILLTMDTPTSGAIDVIVWYYIIVD